MWVEELRLENIKCFKESTTLRLSEKETPYRWVTFLSENGGGKSAALQALGLLLAGPESISNLSPRPIGWLADETKPGLISTRIHQGENDPGRHGESKIRRTFGYSFHVTGSQPLEVRNRVYSEPTVVESPDKNLSWLRQNAFKSTGTGWFAVGYGAFRRLTRSSQIIVPSLEPQARFTNFITQFNEDEPLSAFERWMVYLDYRISKAQDKQAKSQQERAVQAINQLLPENVRFDRVTEEGRILFNVKGAVVPTTTLSDGYRSVLALAGDLVWRLLLAFPESSDPLKEEGVVLIDELDIHLHPTWQRSISAWLRKQFPNLQFIVSTHSPLIAAGAGEDALTLKFDLAQGQTVVTRVDNIASKSVDDILLSDAFGLVSTYTPEAQQKIDRYDSLKRKGKNRTQSEERELSQLRLFMEEAQPFGGLPEPDSLEARMNEFLSRALK